MATREWPPSYDEVAAVERWRKVLFAPPREQMERALGVPDPPDRAPEGLTVGAWRAWREAQQVELAREHWENLVTRGLVPESWLASDDRRFLGMHAVHDPARGTTSTTFQSAQFEHPPSVDAAIAIASDLPNVLAVEQLVREAYRRCAPRLLAPYERGLHDEPERLLWDVSPSPSHPGLYGYPPPSALTRALVSVAAASERTFSYSTLVPRPELLWTVPVVLRTWLSAALACERLDGMLARAIELDLLWEPTDYERQTGRKTMPFSEVTESPYETMLEILRRGYAFYGHDWQHNALRIEALTA